MDNCPEQVTPNAAFGEFGIETEKDEPGVHFMAQWKQIRLGTMRLRVRSLALLSGLRIGHCCGCGVGQSHASDPGVAVAVV